MIASADAHHAATNHHCSRRCFHAFLPKQMTLPVACHAKAAIQQSD
jgi:hypothetical protein